MFKHLSKISIAICAALFIVGIFVGSSMYNSRSPIIEKHVVGTNAIALHVVLALALALAVIISVFYHRNAQKRPYMVWLAPFTKEALSRVKQTLLLKNGTSSAYIIRAVIVAFLVFTSLFYFFRAGMQVLGSQDPNFDVNAWGGPSRLGASLAHWLDGAIIFYVQAWLASFFVVKPKTSKKHRKN